MIDYFAMRTANLDSNLGSTKIVLPVSTGQNHINFPRPRLLLNPRVQIDNSGIYSVGEAAVQTQRFTGITEDFVFL